MRLFWKVYAGVWIASAVLVLGAILISLMPAIMVGGAALLLPYIENLAGSGAPSLGHATAAMGIAAAILAAAVFGAIYLALRALTRRLPARNEGSVSLPPAE
ncbi:MAG TPA: hypothetical protein PL193_16300 [Xanthobacteraceae bacterium]|nr:hypothetical protein [Xanthobacteraceae bacterium]